MKPIIALFEHVVEQHQGTSLATQTWNERTFLRAVTPTQTTISGGDHLQGGIAVMADEHEATVMAFSLRLVCTNGMIAPASLFSKTLSLNPFEEEVLENSLHEAFQAAEEVLQKTTQQFRNAMQLPMDPHLAQRIEMALESLGSLFLSRNDPHELFRLRRSMAQRLQRSATLFEAVNEMTDLARDLPSPQLRWQTEALAGACLMELLNASNPEKTLIFRELLPIAATR